MDKQCMEHSWCVYLRVCTCVCTTYNVRTLYSVMRTLHTVSVQSTLYTVQCTAYTVQCTLYDEKVLFKTQKMKIYNITSTSFVNTQ